MTRKNFTLIARTMLASRPPLDNVDGRRAWADTVDALTDALRSTNPAFNAERFADACNGI
jgi:hypothetical protein